MNSNDESLVAIGVAHDEVEATIWRDSLEREGIAVYVKNADPLTPLGVAPLPGSQQLFVLGKDEKRARLILGDGEDSA